MAKTNLLKSLLLLSCGAIAGGFLAAQVTRRSTPLAPVGAQTGGRAAEVDSTKLQADVAHLKDIVPGQSHAMIDVGYHMVNLWFAVQKRNWPFAAFELDETRNRIRWTIRINPVRKDPEGKDVDLKSIFDGIDQSSMAMLKRAVEKKDSAAFVVAYKQMLESCYACHKASGKPYLRPMIPTAPLQTIMNDDPNAGWPE
jgi:cytochrome c553